jgi:hypothetical protein
MSDVDFDRAIKIVDGKFAELHAHIGSICTSFAHLELELINAIGLLLDDVELIVGELVCDKLSYSQTVDLFERLAKYRLRQKLPDELADLVSNLRRAAVLRNEVIHSSWSCSLDERPMLSQERVRRKHTVRQQEIGTIPFDKLLEIANFIDDLFMELQTFETEYL